MKIKNLVKQIYWNMKSNIIAKKPKPQYPKNKPLLLTRKAVSASAVYAILDTDLAVGLNNLRVFPSLEEKMLSADLSSGHR